MKDNPYRQDREEMRELLKQYTNLKEGKFPSFLEEESFESIIDYFDEKDDMASAIEAVGYGISQYPYSSMLKVKNADLLIATRQYRQALDILEKAEILDSTDINIYILKTDAYLALTSSKKLLTCSKKPPHL